MKKVAVYGQPYPITAPEEISVLLKFLNKNNIEVCFEKLFYDLIKKDKLFTKRYATFSHFDDLSDDFDAMFTIGGDGTLLRAVTYVRNLNIPLIGINTGRLGFLATIQKEEIDEAIELLIKKEYHVQERGLICVETYPKIDGFSSLNFALNEVTVSRRNTTAMIGVRTELNQQYLTNYWADGLIISTPTGSTGYSLSCSGPVILPDCKTMVITPIAPHNLNARPMVIPDNTIINLEVSSRENSFLISLDSRITVLPVETKIKIKKADFTIKTIIPKNQYFLKNLRSKLLWGEDARNL